MLSTKFGGIAPSASGQQNGIRLAGCTHGQNVNISASSRCTSTGHVKVHRRVFGQPIFGHALYHVTFHYLQSLDLLGRASRDRLAHILLTKQIGKKPQLKMTVMIIQCLGEFSLAGKIGAYKDNLTL